MEENEKNNLNENKSELKIKVKRENKEGLESSNEPKSYLNFGICQLSLGIIFTYSYIICSILLNLVNRVIYQTYNFKYNYFLMFCQQFACLIVFTFVFSKNEIFIKQTGELSFNDFYKYKYDYILFGFIFILNTLSSFYGNQLVLNVSMFVTLRKLVLVMLLFFDFYFRKKKFTIFTVTCVILITIGTLLIGSDDFTKDYLGYSMVIINNTLTIVYIKLLEEFKNKTGCSNLKLLVYNSYLANPILIIAIFISGEYKKIYLFFCGDVPPFEGSYFGYFFILFLSCFMCIILNSSFFISNEKNSSIFTQLLSNSKDIFLSFLSYFFLKDNPITFKIIFGLAISNVGALLASTKSFCDNFKIGGKKEEVKDEFKPIMTEMDSKKIEVKE